MQKARVLEPDAVNARGERFAPDTTTQEAIEQAIETVRRGRRSRLNLAINDSDTYCGPYVGLITQRLDELIRESTSRW